MSGSSIFTETGRKEAAKQSSLKRSNLISSSFQIFFKIIHKCLWLCWMNLDNNWSSWQGDRTMFLWKVILLRRYNQQGKKNNYISHKQCEKWVFKHVSFEKIMPVSGFVQFRIIGSKKELVAWMNIPLEFKQLVL